VVWDNGAGNSPGSAAHLVICDLRSVLVIHPSSFRDRFVCFRVCYSELHVLKTSIGIDGSITKVWDR
jgi:hypothetical protein